MSEVQPASNEDTAQHDVRRRRGTSFYQQRLPAWRPNLTAPTTTIPVMIVVGSLFVCIGMVLQHTSDNVQEFSLDYTDVQCQPSVQQLRLEYGTCASYLQSHPGHRCFCDIDFQLIESFQGKVYMYYGLSNYYQNHRLYTMSKDINQLAGRLPELNLLLRTSSCYPFVGDSDDNVTYAPCGLIANSLFNDTLTLTYKDLEDNVISVPLLNTGIAWTTDKEIRFRNPAEGFAGTVPPPNWQRPVYDLDPNNASNTGYQNEDLMVWMRVAAFPTFRKLYRRIDHSVSRGPLLVFERGLPAGNYTLTVGYAYPVVLFSSRKQMILATTTWLGGKNPFIGRAYFCFGIICILFSLILSAAHIKCSAYRQVPRQPVR